MVFPILAYGSEVWGPYLKFDFQNWDKSECEKVHLRFCKMFPEVNRKTSNIATKKELGRLPLQIPLMKRVLKVLYLLK